MPLTQQVIYELIQQTIQERKQAVAELSEYLIKHVIERFETLPDSDELTEKAKAHKELYDAYVQKLRAVSNKLYLSLIYGIDEGAIRIVFNENLKTDSHDKTKDNQVYD